MPVKWILSPRSWGVDSVEAARPLACDRCVARLDDVYVRGCSVHAPVDTVYRWLCQLRAAPYSYDWIDNLGRRSPRALTPGLDALAVGQKVMSIFRIVSFETNDHLTVLLRNRLFGEVAVTYAVVPEARGTRLIGRVALRYPDGLWGRLVRAFLPLGDLVMMRKQFLTLKALAERGRRG
jgi:hypothetical protein